MIVIVDYGMGNLGSILNMLKRIGAEAMISGRAADIESAGKLILPGVGAFDNGMRNLAERGLIDVLNRVVLEQKKPILGICLGVQLFTSRSEEGTLPGLGWIDAETIRFRFDGDNAGLKIPHMGWNTIEVRRQDSILAPLPEEPRFYFVHSYHVRCRNASDVLAVTRYGIEFHSAVMRENIVGTQFHPEKSHRYGMQVLRNFAEVRP
jgi:imidazole glycerol-phosphate synthase subunit HisH